jgi:hypothetical protein
MVVLRHFSRQLVWIPERILAGGWFYVSIRDRHFCGHTFGVVSASQQTAQVVGSSGVVGSSIALDFIFGYVFECRMIYPPNKSPEPTAVGAVSSAVAVHVTSRRWLSFFR